MQILLTEVTSGLGRALAASLLAAGHDVTAIADGAHRDLYRLAAEADVVLLLPGPRAGVRSADVVRICDAAARGGARIVFPSLSLLEPARWSQAEELVRTGWAPNLIVRLAAPLGRQVDAPVCRSVAAVLAAPTAGVVHVIHVDDVVRFLVAAADSDRTGTVDLATADTATVVSAQQILGRVDPRPRARPTDGWAVLSPAVDIAPLRDEWHFECAWGATDTVLDTVRGLQGRKLSPDGARTVAGRIPMPVSPAGRPARSDLLRATADEAEFDDRIDPRFPVFVASPFAETSSGPLTPMSLDLHLPAVRVAAGALAELLDVPATLAPEWGERLVAVFGHRVYLGASAIAAAASRLPGRAADVGAQLCAAADMSTVAAHRRLLRNSPLSMTRVISGARMLGRHVEAYADAAEAEYRDADAVSALGDAQLGARIRLLCSRIHEGWTVAAQAWLLSELAPAQLAGAHRDGIRIESELASLASVLRAHPYIQDALSKGDLDAVRAAAPMVATALDSVIAHLGHRGPGGVEVAASVIGDRTDALIAAGERARQRYSSGHCGEPQLYHLLAYDSLLRFTHQMRLALRELARRRVAEDKLAAIDDIFLLTVEEALVMPVDARLRVKRRAAERERLQAVRVPAVIDGGWTPQPLVDVAAAGEQLRGTRCEGGAFEGTVQVVSSAADTGLGPGDVAVVATADVESLALFGTPGAVIVEDGARLTDTSGLGVPVVAGVADATARLVTGSSVRVDGATGTVVVLADSRAVAELVAGAAT